MDIDAIINGKFVYTASELADALGVSVPTTRRWRRQPNNPLRFSKLGGTVLFTREHVIEFIISNITGLSRAEKERLKLELTRKEAS